MTDVMLCVIDLPSYFREYGSAGRGDVFLGRKA